MTDHHAVRACISQLRRMAEDMLATAAMLENGIEREERAVAADAYDNAKYEITFVRNDGEPVRIEDLDEETQAMIKMGPIFIPCRIVDPDAGLCVPPDVLERDGKVVG